MLSTQRLVLCYRRTGVSRDRWGRDREKGWMETNEERQKKESFCAAQRYSER